MNLPAGGLEIKSLADALTNGGDMMSDVTKRRFFEMLDCVDDPVIEVRDRGRFGQVCFYSDVLLIFSGSFNAALENMRSKGFAPLLMVSAPRTGIVLGSCRGTMFGMGDDGGRTKLKAAKYKRWLWRWLNG